ncbi:MAG: hypothetical protein U5P41_05740 [Gammaproteobacteria bacterium]|nr:hypothetical protein [Gammaproteobacteria bacterium]
MSLAETFLQPALWLAIALFTLGGLVLMPLVWLIEARLPSKLLQWQWEHVAMPLAANSVTVVIHCPGLAGAVRHTQRRRMLIAILSVDSGRGIRFDQPAV